MTRRQGIRAVVFLALPAIASYILNNFYRINDQFWTRDLGEGAKDAMGAAMYVAILNFSLFFLAGAGALSLVARATGAREPERRDSFMRHALFLAVLLGGLLTAIGRGLTPSIVALLNLKADVVPDAEAYLGMLYTVSIPMALAPTIDHLFIARGNTLIPMLLQSCAIGINYMLNPVFIFGARAGAVRAVPGAEFAGHLAEWLVAAGWIDAQGYGVAGAALATGASRAVSSTLGLSILVFGFGLNPLGSLRPKLGRLLEIVRISLPVCSSIMVYALAYWALTSLVITRLAEPAVLGGLGVGFQVFEGLAFPCYIGIGSAAASLVGRMLGAGDPDGALRIVWSARMVGRVLGFAMTLAFLFLAEHLIPLFSDSAAVQAQTRLYVSVLAFSQFFVATEAVNEKVLVGSGYTRPILFISPLGNLLRIPLAWGLALGLGWGAAGVWWAINLTTYFKAFLLWREVQSGRWLGAASIDPHGPPRPPAGRRGIA